MKIHNITTLIQIIPSRQYEFILGILCECEHARVVFALRGSFPKLNADKFTPTVSTLLMTLNKTISL